MRTLILDFDGTIADTSAAIISAFCKTFEKLDLPTPADGEIRQTIGLPLRDAFAQLSGMTEDAAIDRGVDTYRSLFDDSADGSIVIYPGVKETLEQLKAAGVILTVASSRSHKSLPGMLDRLGIAPLIDMVVAAEDVEAAKPAPDMVLKILEATHTAPYDALVVGDTTYDIEMGHAAGTRTCAVTYGNHPTERLIAAHPNYMIDLFHDTATIALKRF